MDAWHADAKRVEETNCKASCSGGSDKVSRPPTRILEMGGGGSDIHAHFCVCGVHLFLLLLPDIRSSNFQLHHCT